MKLFLSFIFSNFLKILTITTLKRTSAEQECEGLNDFQLEKCCSLKSYQNSKNFEEIILKMALDDDPGDMKYVLPNKNCEIEKNRLEHGLCQNIPYMKPNFGCCTFAPFVREQKMIQKGYLQISENIDERLKSECASKRFLLWTRVPKDYFVGHNHKSFSFRCMLKEAISLNRTLVIDDFVAMQKEHTNLDLKIVEVPYIAWYDSNFINKYPMGYVMWQDFKKECGTPGVLTKEDNSLSIVKYSASFSEMNSHSETSLLVRDFTSSEKSEFRYGFKVCSLNNDTNAIPSNYKIDIPIRPAKGFINRMVDDMMTLLEDSNKEGLYDDYVCFHIRRGDKIGLKQYPNLDEETSPKRILEILEDILKPNSTVFIATNEINMVEFFSPLEEKYRIASIYHTSSIVNHEKFIPSTLALIDYGISGRCKRFIPTFSSEKSKGFEKNISLSKSPK